MNTKELITKKLKAIDTHVENFQKKLQTLPGSTAELQETWLLLREYLGKTTTKSASTFLTSMNKKIPVELGLPKNSENFAPLLEIAKLPLHLRLELTILIENLVAPLADEPIGPESLSKVKDLLNTFGKGLTEFADKNKKITLIGAITTTIAAFGGFLVGAALAPFAPLILPVIAGYYTKKKTDSIAKAIGAGIVGFLAGILLIPFLPLLVAALPIINNTAIFNFQLDQIKKGGEFLTNMSLPDVGKNLGLNAGLIKFAEVAAEKNSNNKLFKK
jgi:hypothetical protein